MLTFQRKSIDKKKERKKEKGEEKEARAKERNDADADVEGSRRILLFVTHLLHPTKTIHSSDYFSVVSLFNGFYKLIFFQSKLINLNISKIFITKVIIIF